MTNDPNAPADSGEVQPRKIKLAPVTLAILGVLTAVWLLQFLAGLAWPGSAEWAFERFGASGAAVRAGHIEVLVTSIFLHAGLWHLLGNASGLAAFSEAVTRAFPPKLGQWLWYPLFFLACGIAGSIAYVVLHLNGGSGAVGASGAICGVWGASARLYHAPPGHLSRVLSRAVWEQTKAFLILNLVLVAGLYFLSGGSAFVAWEAHAGGYLFGLLAIGPVLKFAWRRAQ